MPTMNGFDLLRLMGSRELPTLFVVAAGILYMVGLHKVAIRLIVATIAMIFFAHILFFQAFAIQSELPSLSGWMLASSILALLTVAAFVAGYNQLTARLLTGVLIAGAGPILLVSYLPELKPWLSDVPAWARVPLISVAVVILGSWILWACVFFFFGPTIANSVTADILSWAVKAGIVVLVTPYRRLSGLMRRISHQDPLE